MAATVSSQRACDPPPLGETLPAPIDALRREALAALLTGHLHAAVDGFGAVAKEGPADFVSLTLRGVAFEELTKLTATSPERIDRARVVHVTDPPVEHMLHERVPVTAPLSEPPELSVTEVTKEAYEPAAEHSTLLGAVDGEWWQSGVFVHQDHLAFTIGFARLALAARNGEESVVVDFSGVLAERPTVAANARPTGRIRAAEVVGHTLLVALDVPSADASHGGRGGQTAPRSFVGAVDIDTGAVRWWSAPGIGSALLATGGFVIVAMTDGNDTRGTVGVLDLATGATVGEDMRAPFAPGAITRDDGGVIVRGRRGGHARVRLSTGFVPPDPPALGPLPPAPNALLSCVALRVMAALDRGEVEMATGLLDGLAESTAPVTRALRAAAAAVLADRLKPKEVDLNVAAVHRLPDLPAAFDPTSSVSPAAAPRLRLVRVGERWVGERGDGVNDFHPEEPWYQVALAPRLFGSLPLHAAVASGDGGLLFYGNRYVAVLRERAVVGIVDAESLGASARPSRELFGVLDGETLFVGNHSFIVAVNVTTGTPLWRSASGTSSTNLLLVDGVLVTAAPTGDHGGAVLVLRADTGAVVQRLNFSGRPQALVRAGDEVSVMTEVVITRYLVVQH